MPGFPSHTKRGPGRKPTHARNPDKKTGQLFLLGILATWAMKRREKLARKGRRDADGGFTLTGRNRLTGERRKWLAGISAQRGY